MKYGIGSVILATAGICYMVWINYDFSQVYVEVAEKFEVEGGVVPSVAMAYWTDKSIAIGVSLLGLILGIKSYRIGNKIGILGIALSLLLLVLVFLPLWSYRIM